MSGQRDRRRITGIPARPDQRGQGLVEFALVIPLLLILFMGIIEGALALNAVIGVNRASQHAAHTAAILGNQAGADCLILRDIEGDVTVPNDRSKILYVLIQRTAMVGNSTYETQTWNRGGSTNCVLPDGSAATVPYTLAVGSNYPEDVRCNTLTGCPVMGAVPARSTVDNVGVAIQYRHNWATPLNAMLDVFGGNNVGWTINQRNIFRMEPIL